MKLYVLATGSSGNASIVQGKHENIALDFGLSYSKWHNLLEKNNHLVLEVINELPKNAENFNTETIFESFNRGNQRDNKGHGLGLTIASQIVSRHYGEIKMDYLSSDKIKVSVLFPE